MRVKRNLAPRPDYVFDYLGNPFPPDAGGPSNGAAKKTSAKAGVTTAAEPDGSPDAPDGGWEGVEPQEPSRKTKYPVRAAAEELIQSGFAVCRVRAGQKQPTDTGWTTRSAAPEEFRTGDSVGIVCGPLSNGGYDGYALVGVDLDSEEANALADQFLPQTDMEEGRPGKPRSHRYYLVRLDSIPEAFQSTAPQSSAAARKACGHPGPAKKYFDRVEAAGDGKTTRTRVIDFQGVGGQCVVPPSIHEGTGKPRYWEGGHRGEPPGVEFPELWQAVCDLAVAAGATLHRVGRAGGVDPSRPTAEPAPLVTDYDPADPVVQRCGLYLDKLPPAVSGQGGHNALFRAACVAAWGFALDEEVAAQLLADRYNPRCEPPWSTPELRHKVESAVAATSHERPRGHLRDAKPGTAGEGDLSLRVTRRKGGKCTVVATWCGERVHRHALDLDSDDARTRYAKALAGKRDEIDAAVAARLMDELAAQEEAAEDDDDPGGDGEDDGRDAADDGREVEVRQVVRPEQFFTEHVSGITVPATFDRGGMLIRRWLVCIRWADGLREVHDLKPCVEVPGGGTLHVDPVPATPRDGIPTDRYPAYDHLPVSERQVCWAHLRRDFQAMIDRRNDGSGVGEDLLMHADILLMQWKRVRDGTLTRRGFRQSYLGWIREEVLTLLGRGAGCGCATTAGVCRELLAVEPALYTFARVEAVEPTNNAAERALRHAVCWRKTSYGTDSPSGSRFVERVLTVVATCRQQGRDALDYLAACCRAARDGVCPPSLVPGCATGR